MGIIVVFGSVNDPKRVTSKAYSKLRQLVGQRHNQKIHIVRLDSDSKASVINDRLHDLSYKEQTPPTYEEIESELLRSAFGEHSLDDVLAYVLPLDDDSTDFSPDSDDDDSTDFSPDSEWEWVIDLLPDSASGYKVRQRHDGKGTWLDWTGRGPKIL
mgnify:CR=1 FL=1|tara:strand:- start:4036 stop:4506 length:471 start_codon:yes stop_codon:yes gene_type:complete